MWGDILDKIELGMNALECIVENVVETCIGSDGLGVWRRLVL